MDVLKRRMFNIGGSVEASNVLGRGSGFTSARPGMRRFERDADGNVLFTTYDTAGNIIQEELVDMRLSETGDPEEALAKQRQNKAASAMVDAAFATPALKGVQLGTQALMKGSKFARGTRDVLAETAGLPVLAAKKMAEVAAPFKFNPKFVANPKAGQKKKDFFGNPVMKDSKPVIEPKKTLQQRSIFDPKSYQEGGVQIKPFTTSIYGTPVLLEGRSQLLDVVTQEPEMAEIIDREVEDDLQAEIDGLSPTGETGDVTQGADGADQGNEQGGTDTDDQSGSEDGSEGKVGDGSSDTGGVAAAQTTANSLSDFFGSSAFNDALRNIGSSLVKEGRFGAGLAAGASAFADEQEAKSLMAQERMAELIEAGAEDELDFGEISKVSDKGAEVNENIKNFEGANASIGIMNDVIALFEEAEKKGIAVTGLGGRLSRFKDEASAFFNLGGEPGTATRIKNMIKVVKNRQIREILGESGRTISDLDRKIVDDVFGEIELTTSPEIALKKLRDAREQLKSSARRYQRDIRTGGTALALPQSGQLGQTYLSEFSDLINDILKVNVDQLDVAGYNPTVGARVVKMTLAEVKGD